MANFNLIRGKDEALIHASGWSGPYTSGPAFDPADEGKQGEVRYNGTEYVIYTHEGWVKAPGYEMFVNPGIELERMYEWYREKRIQEDLEAELLEKHPQLKEYKEQYEFMKKMVSDVADKSA